jgi:hypothetical protein
MVLTTRKVPFPSVKYCSGFIFKEPSGLQYVRPPVRPKENVKFVQFMASPMNLNVTPFVLTPLPLDQPAVLPRP